MTIINFSEKNSIFNKYIAEIRDTTIQKDQLRFRRNLERMGEIFAYEISKKIKYDIIDVNTPLGIAQCNVPQDYPVLATILRAGIPLHNGILNFFDKSPSTFLAAYRKYGKDNKFDIQIEYISFCNLEKKIVILTDPMIATGSSMYLSYKKLCEFGTPSCFHIVSCIASQEGVDYLSKMLPHRNVTLWVGAIDEELTIKSYIVPGLGDAGDLAYGEKNNS